MSYMQNEGIIEIIIEIKNCLPLKGVVITSLCDWLKAAYHEHLLPVLPTSQHGQI